MLLRLCRFLLPSRRRPPRHNHSGSHGQVLVLFAVALVVLLLFAGLAIDAGALYVTYGHLKRAVDSAAVAAANDFKRGETLARMTEAAREVLHLHNVNVESVDMQVYICDADRDGSRDASLQTTVPQFYALCPNTDAPANEAPRKLVWVEANMRAPLYFLQLVGIEAVDLNTNAIAEAAPVDVVIVLDISESMASDTIEQLRLTYPDIIDNYDPDGGDPPGCNLDNSCQPLLAAKNAANALIDTLYEGYDRVSLVTFSQVAVTHPIRNKKGIETDLSDDLSAAKAKVSNVRLWDDPPFARMWQTWVTNSAFNPVNPEDRDGDGQDADPLLPTCATAPANPMCCNVDDDRWDSSAERAARGVPVAYRDPFGWGGLPCDADNLNDAYDWDGDGVFTAADDAAANAWLVKSDPDGMGPMSITLSPLSTCTGCGIRTAANILKQHGRPGAVWVIVFLSDGIVNLSDRPGTLGNIPIQYPNGFCTGKIHSDPAERNFWGLNVCIDSQPTPRYCIDSDSETCPPGTTWTGATPNLHYSVLDYARDMADEAALTKSTNLKEPAGNDIAIYTIGLGNAVGGTGAGQVAESLLRYMAAVGADGDRETDPCRSAAARTTCGQYYYAPSGDALLPIFENIASRIYTRITQ